jgi:hypothetical protein
MHLYLALVVAVLVADFLALEKLKAVMVQLIGANLQDTLVVGAFILGIVALHSRLAHDILKCWRQSNSAQLRAGSRRAKRASRGNDPEDTAAIGGLQ